MFIILPASVLIMSHLFQQNHLFSSFPDIILIIFSHFNDSKNSLARNKSFSKYLFDTIETLLLRPGPLSRTSDPGDLSVNNFWRYLTLIHQSRLSSGFHDNALYQANIIYVDLYVCNRGVRAISSPCQWGAVKVKIDKIPTVTGAKGW